MAITLNGTTGITTPDVTSDGSLKIDASAPDDSLVVDASGNVGIGTDTPNSYNALGGTIAAVAGSGISNLSIVSSASSTGNILFADGTSGDERRAGRIAYDHSLNNLYFFTNGNNLRTTINSSGYLLVGTTSSAQDARVTFQGSTSNNRAIACVSAVTSFSRQISFVNPNGLVGGIVTDGSSTSYSTSSDYRLKENVVGVTGASARVQQLNPVRFNFIADPDTTVDGFLAHEVQDVVPEAITGTKDAVDAKGNPEYQGIDQSKLVPLLTAALQEALGKIETLEARVAALEGGV